MNKRWFSKLKKRPSEKRWGNRVNERLKKQDELVSYGTQTAVLASAIGSLFPDALKDFREAMYNVRHAMNTTGEMVLGTQGQRGLNELKARHLEDALKIIDNSKAENVEAARKLQEHQDARGKFIQEMAETYKTNETLTREAQRLTVQLKGVAKNLFEIGNDVKADWWKENIDAPVIITYGKALRQLGKEGYKNLSDDQIIAKAIESSQQLKEFYQNARKFYDAREKSETTIREFTEYLARVQNQAISDNKKIEEQFPKLVSRLKEGYSLEDTIFEVNVKGTDMTKQDVAEVKTQTADYRGKVDQTRTEVGTAVPLPAYSETNWVDWATDPFVLAASAVLIGNTAMRLLTPGFAYNAFQKTVALPFRWTTKKLLNGVSYAKDIVIPYDKNGRERKEEEVKNDAA